MGKLQAPPSLGLEGRGVMSTVIMSRNSGCFLENVIGVYNPAQESWEGFLEEVPVKLKSDQAKSKPNQTKQASRDLDSNVLMLCLPQPIL